LHKLTRDEEAQIAVAQDGSNTDETRTSTRYNTHILPCVLALPPLAVVLVVQLRNSLPQRPDTSCWAVFSAVGTDINLFRPLEASFYAIVDLGRTLTQICPFFGLLEETVLVGLLRSPHNTSRGAGGIETSMGLVAFVRGAELSMDT
jgi:hypothetical protein